MPLGLLYLGFVVIMVVGLGVGQLFKLVTWFFR